MTEELDQEHFQDSSDPWIGKVVDSRYRILERLGQGGMGVVYKVEHTRMGKIAAIKFVHENLVSDKILIKRFHREAEAISKLNHPNIVQVFDFGYTDNTLYLVMEYLKGEDLKKILQRDGQFTFRRSAAILIQICNALSEAHHFGIVHRDLKPENIRIGRTRDGQDFVKVLDFGLAKMVEEETSPAITGQGKIVGTPYYMAPEQIRGEDVDLRCDIYSLGAITYRMLTGTYAFNAKTPLGVLTKHITEEVSPPSQSAPDWLAKDTQLAAAIDAIVLRAMAKKREDRFQSAEMMKEAICQVAGQSSDSILLLSVESDTNKKTSRPERRSADISGVSQNIPVELAPTAKMDVDTISAISDQRLCREDIDFERKIKRSRNIRISFLLALLMGTCFAAYWIGFKKTPQVAPSEEIESNNTPDTATLLELDKAVTGTIGKRLSSTESDRDWYRFEVQKEGSFLLRAEVTRIPNMNIVLSLYDGVGGKIVDANSADIGGNETITNWPIKAGTYYLLVREFWTNSITPTENVTDTYRLWATISESTNDDEHEPNDTPKQASILKPPDKVKGFLGSIKDQDYYKIEPEGESLSGEITGIPGVDLVLNIILSDGKTIPIDKEKNSDKEQFKRIKIKDSDPIFIHVKRKDETMPPAGYQPRGLTIPYTLKVWED